MHRICPQTKGTGPNPRNGETNILAQNGTETLKKDDEDKYIALKEKLRLKKSEKALKKTQPAVIATKVTKAKPNTKLSEKLRATRRAFKELRKKKVLRTTVQVDQSKITHAP